MKQNRVISTAVLFLLLGSVIPALAQKGEEEKGGGGAKAQPAQHQAQPQQRAQKAQPQQRAQQAQRQQPQQRAQSTAATRTAGATSAQQRAQKAQHATARPAGATPAATARTASTGSPEGSSDRPLLHNSGGGHYGRISDTSYRAHFGHDHSFHMMRPQMIGGYNRFQYGGYWFGFNQGWPVGWSYDDTVYVEYIDGAYYLCDLRFPGVQITLNMF